MWAQCAHGGGQARARTLGDVLQRPSKLPATRGACATSRETDLRGAGALYDSKARAAMFGPHSRGRDVDVSRVGDDRRLRDARFSLGRRDREGDDNCNQRDEPAATAAKRLHGIEVGNRRAQRDR